MKKNNILLIFIFLFFATSAFSQKKSPSTIFLQNEFIKVEANVEEFDTGRFSIDTVKGDPTRDADDNKILIYGHPKPWTSFTTIRIDGENYIFGGRTKKRAGKAGKFGEVISPPYISGNSIITRCKFGNIVVTQILSIVQGPASKLFDTVKISYIVENIGTSSHRVGVRIVLDTMLGANDGAPFRVGERNITSEEKMEGEQIPQWWIVFDNLDAPTIIAKGTLKGDDILPPDKVIFSNWGKVADNVWSIPFVGGQSFQREGEDDLDTAISLIWEEREFLPQSSQTYTTLYGLEYLNIIGDVLRVGVPVSLGEISTARGQIKPFTLVAYLLNRGGFELKDVRVSLELPDGLLLYGEEVAEKTVGRMQHGQEINIAWQIIPVSFAEGEKYIKVKATALDLEKVENKTKVELIPPPYLSVNLDAPDKLLWEKKKGYIPNPFEIKLKVKNKGRSPVNNIVATLSIPEGIKFPQAINPSYTLSRLEPQEEFEFSWKIIPTGEVSGEITYKIVISSDTTDEQTIYGKIFIPTISKQLFFSYQTPKDFFPISINLISPQQFSNGKMTVSFDPSFLHCVYISQGEIFAQDSIWQEPVIDNKTGKIIFPKQTRNVPFSGEGVFATLNFRAKKEGKTKIDFLDVELFDIENKIMEVEIISAEIEIIK